MKKKFKKLSLSTETLRNLNEPDLKEAVGAATAANTECTANCTLCTKPCTLCTVQCTPCCP